MRKFFDINNQIFEFMSKVSDLLVLNALWILCSLPIITAGASSAALYYCTLRILRKNDTYVWKMFFHSFKENLRQGILLILIFLGLVLLLGFDFFICFEAGTSWGMVLLGILLVVALIILMSFSFVFPYLAQFENSIWNIFKNSFTLAMSHLPVSVFVMLLNVLPVILLVVSVRAFLYGMSFWLLIGFALTARVNSIFFARIFSKYMPMEDEHIQQEE